jgi:hypothetical protein
VVSNQTAASDYDYAYGDSSNNGTAGNSSSAADSEYSDVAIGEEKTEKDFNTTGPSAIKLFKA